jgi:hypothetical protein
MMLLCRELELLSDWIVPQQLNTRYTSCKLYAFLYTTHYTLCIRTLTSRFRTRVLPVELRTQIDPEERRFRILLEALLVPYYEYRSTCIRVLPKQPPWR